MQRDRLVRLSGLSLSLLLETRLARQHKELLVGEFNRYVGSHYDVLMLFAISPNGILLSPVLYSQEVAEHCIR